jgi:hypothetical protein
VIDEEGLASSALAGLDIAPSIPYEIARRAIDVELPGGSRDQTRQRLAAFASIIVIVKARKDGIQGESGHQSLIDGVHHRLRNRTSCHIRLVGDDYESVSSGLQGMQRLGYAR